MPKQTLSRIFRICRPDPPGDAVKAANLPIKEAMLSQNRDESPPESTIGEYIEACRVGSVDRLHATFTDSHPAAAVSIVPWRDEPEERYAIAPAYRHSVLQMTNIFGAYLQETP